MLFNHVNMDSYQVFFSKVVGFYKWLAIAPWKVALEEPWGAKSANPHRRSWLSVMCVLVIYWAILIYLMCTKESKEDLVSSLSNNIQMILNAFAFSAAIFSNAYNNEHFSGILKQFKRIDDRLLGSGCHIDYKGKLKVFHMAITLFFVLLVSTNTFEFVVSVQMKEVVPLVYWMIHAIPFLVYGMSLHMAIFFIFDILHRCRLVNSLLKRKRFSIRNVRALSVTTLQVLPSAPKGNPSNKEDTIKLVYLLTDEVHELCERVNQYFGLTFFASILALFAVTSIQSFYCYKIACDFDEERGRTVWTLFTSVNPVLLNILLLVVLCYYSEMVTNEATKINTNVRKLEDEHAVQYSSWFHPVLIHIKVSAFNCFDINFTMLCGFFSAWITYLFILVQYNEIAGDKLKDNKVYNAQK